MDNATSLLPVGLYDQLSWFSHDPSCPAADPYLLFRLKDKRGSKRIYYDNNCNRFISVEVIILLLNNNWKGKIQLHRLNEKKESFHSFLSFLLFFLFPYVRSFLLSRLLHKFLLSLTIFFSQDNGGPSTTSADYETSRASTTSRIFKKSVSVENEKTETITRMSSLFI